MTRKRGLRGIQGWLRTTLTVAEVEDHFAFADREWQESFGYPAGWLARFNREIKAIMQPGDELWWYHSGSVVRKRIRVQKGIALVRNGRVIHFILESRN